VWYHVWYHGVNGVCVWYHGVTMVCGPVSVP